MGTQGVAPPGATSSRGLRPPPPPALQRPARERERIRERTGARRAERKRRKYIGTDRDLGGEGEEEARKRSREGGRDARFSHPLPFLPFLLHARPLPPFLTSHHPFCRENPPRSGAPGLKGDARSICVAELEAPGKHCLRCELLVELPPCCPGSLLCVKHLHTQGFACTNSASVTFRYTMPGQPCTPLSLKIRMTRLMRALPRET